MTRIEVALASFTENRTLEAAQRLEASLDDAYPNDPFVQECVEALACYRPGGGEWLFDGQQIEPHLQRLRAHLEGEHEFRKLSVELGDVRSVIMEDGGSSALILTGGSATIIEHSAPVALSVTSYLQANGIAVYRSVDDVPAHHLPDVGDTLVEHI